MAANEKFIAEFQVKGLDNIDRAKDKINALNDRINGLATTLLGVGFASFIGGALQTADRISDFSDATNISISSLKAFGAALDDSGGKAKNTEKIINSFYAAIDTANQGSLKTRDAFAAVGISISDLGKVSETELLNKVIKNLALMPSGAERAAVATELLSRAFRGVDPAKFKEVLDPEQYLANEAATKKAAAAQQLLEEKYRTLQEGAIAALEPILKLLGQTKLSIESATQVVQALGLALGVTFGLSVVANIISIGKALAALNILTKTNAVLQAGIIALQGPKGWAMLAGAVVATGAVYVGFNKILEDMAANKAAENHLKNLAEQAAETAGEITKAQAATGGKLTAAKSDAGNANRKQELDTRQRAMIESEKRIADSQAEIRKLSAIETSSELEKIEAERIANIQKITNDITSKTDLSRLQKAKEIAQKTAEFDKKAATDSTVVRKDLEAQLLQQKQQYAQANNALLGIEQTELQKITDQIAQQPLKYKEIGDQLSKNAVLQDAEKKRIEEVIRLRQAEREAFGLMTSDMTSAIQQENKRAEIIASAYGTNKLGLEVLKAEGEERSKLYDLANNTKGAYEARLITDGRIGELTKQQIADAITYNEQLAYRQGIIQNEKNDKIALAALDQELAQNFSVGWNKAYNQYVESSKNSADQAGQYFNTFSKGFEDVFANMAKSGEFSFKSLKDGFKSVANSLIADFIRIQAQKALVGIFGGAGADAGAGIFSAIGSIFGFANGGSPPVNRPSIVGERGAELFIPKTAGTIIPNNMLGMGGGNNTTNVTYSIQAVDAQSFKTLLARDPEFLHNVAEQGRRSMPIRSRR